MAAYIESLSSISEFCGAIPVSPDYRPISSQRTGNSVEHIEKWFSQKILIIDD